MEIGIVTNLIDERSGGIGVYTSNLIKYLNDIDRKNNYYLIHYASSDLDIYNFNNEIIIPKYFFKKTIFWRYLTLPWKLKSYDNLDIVHDPYEMGPLSFKMPFKKVITIHDLAPIIFPQLYNSEYIIYKLLYQKTVHNADKIITVSEHSKKDIIKYLKVPEHKISVTYNGIDKIFKSLSLEESSKIKEKYNINYPFILFVGGLHPIKNVDNLIKSFYKLKKSGIKHKLVIVGKKVFRWDKLFKITKKLNLENDVIFLGLVENKDLVKLYNLADLFVYPPLYAGFGIPPLESMACDTPVITSNNSSLPEVVGDAGLLIDPYNTDELTRSIKNVLNDDGLKEGLIKKGFDRIKMFNWDKTADSTLKIYNEVYNS